MTFRARLTRDDNDTWLAEFPDVPGAHSFGKTEADALRRGRDALITVLEDRVQRRQEIPYPPAPAAGESFVTLSPQVGLKVGLYRAMLRAGITKADLRRRLNWNPPQVDRLLDFSHRSRSDQIYEAAAALGPGIERTVTLSFPCPTCGTPLRELARCDVGWAEPTTGALDDRTVKMGATFDCPADPTHLWHWLEGSEKFEPLTSSSGLGLRAIAWVRSGPIAAGGRAFQWAVTGLPHNQQAWLYRAREEGDFQILRVANGVQGAWFGKFESAQDALKELARQVRAKSSTSASAMRRAR